MITGYSFGHMVINGKGYSSDLIIYPDGRVRSSWWRKSGHVLSSSDINDLIETAPQAIVAGTGAYGMMKPAPELEKLLAEKGIEFLAAPTKEAVGLYNDLSGRKSTGGCFHLTC